MTQILLFVYTYVLKANTNCKPGKKNVEQKRKEPKETLEKEDEGGTKSKKNKGINDVRSTRDAQSTTDGITILSKEGTNDTKTTDEVRKKKRRKGPMIPKQRLRLEKKCE